MQNNRKTDPARRKRNFRRRVIAYGSILGLAYAFFLWVPWEYDFIARTPPSPNPSVDPDRAKLFSPAAKVLLITAHPDDSAFYLGGFLTKLGKSGAQIHQVICTDGDKAYYGPFADGEKNRNIRRAEALEELRAWGGKDIWFLARPDGRLRADESLVARIRKEIDRVRPDYVIAFDGDFPPRMSHQDHRRAGDAAEKAVKGTGVQWLMKFSTIAPNYVEDISDNWEDQRKLLAIHRSQFFGSHLERVENMVESSAVSDGERIEKTYGEGFRCLRINAGGR